MTINTLNFLAAINSSDTGFNTFVSGSSVGFLVTYDSSSGEVLGINANNAAYVDVPGYAPSSAGVGGINLNGGNAHVSFGTPGDDSTASLSNISFFVFSPYGVAALSNFTSVTNDFSACFTPNTLISTPTGNVAVKDLHIGDLILNHAGESVPVKWIGNQRIHPAFAGDSLPIYMMQGALGNGLPLRDLYVSPGHAFYIDDSLLIDAKALVNGITITQVTQWEGDIEYFHIETENHEIILAEGAPAETFMDNVSRACFNNHSQYQVLYPNAKEMTELDIPRISHQRQLPNAVKKQLEQIAQELLGEGDRAKRRIVG